MSLGGANTLRLLVCGGRDFADELFLFTALDRVHAQWFVNTLIHGDAPGADRLAGAWAAKRGIDLIVFPANWTRYRKRAGPIRNTRMLAEGRPDACVAFPGGAGTANMVAQCRAANVKVWEPAYGAGSA
jgi:hypothetical protein